VLTLTRMGGLLDQAVCNAVDLVSFALGGMQCARWTKRFVMPWILCRLHWRACSAHAHAHGGSRLEPAGPSGL
jgi:hypothetical protein